MKKLISLLVCMAAVQSFGAITYSGDYEGITVGDTLDNNGWTAAASNYTVRDDTSGTPFGAGNKWVEMDNDGTAWTFANLNQIGSATLTTLSFDLYAPSADRGDSFVRIAISGATKNYVLLDVGGSAGGNTDSIDPFASDTAVHFDIVANITGGSGTYEDAVNTIADGTYDVWMDGVKVVDGDAVSAGGAGGIDGVALWMNTPSGTPTDSFYHDNIEIRDTAYAIPEPATLGLFSIIGGALVYIRRRFA